MACERLKLETVDGEIDVPKTDLVSLEVELDTELASMFRLRLAIRQQRDGSWTYLDEEQFLPWMPMRITGGFDNGAEELLSGYITHVKPDFPRNSAQCSLEIWGMDGSVLMDREERLYAWPNETDSAIAAKIFSQHGLSPEVTDTGARHDDTISTIIQRETDMQFLKRLALRNGFECYVEDGTGFFRRPQVNADPQPVLAVHFGRETSVNRFSLEVNALAPTNVTMFQVDRANKEILEETARVGRQKALGAIRAADVLTPGVAPGRVYVSMNAATNAAEMAALCQELFHQAEWFVTAEGEIDGKRYNHVLKPHGTVTIKGVGATYSGVYYVTHVTHTFTPKGYTQFFRAKRNALMPTGLEDFAGTGRPKPNPFLTSKPNPFLTSKPNPFLTSKPNPFL
jgi:phage protein D